MNWDEEPYFTSFVDGNNCIMLGRKNRYNWKWKERHCNEAASYICELEIQQCKEGWIPRDATGDCYLIIEGADEGNFYHARDKCKILGT